MLQIGIHHPDNRSISVFPAMQDGAREAPLAFANQQSNARVLARDGADDLYRAVAAFVIDNENFVFNLECVEHPANSVEQRPEVFCFTKSGNRKGQLAATLRCGKRKLTGCQPSRFPV